MKIDIDSSSLKELVIEYFQRRGMSHSTDSTSTSFPIDLFISRPGETKGLGIILKDWKRAVGVDVLIKAERIMKSTSKIDKVLIVANLFSSPARSLAERVRMFLLTRDDLKRMLSSESVKSPFDDSPVDDKQDMFSY